MFSAFSSVSPKVEVQCVLPGHVRCPLQSFCPFALHDFHTTHSSLPVSRPRSYCIHSQVTTIASTFLFFTGFSNQPQKENRTDSMKEQNRDLRLSQPYVHVKADFRTLFDGRCQRKTYSNYSFRLGRGGGGGEGGGKAYLFLLFSLEFPSPGLNSASSMLSTVSLSLSYFVTRLFTIVSKSAALSLLIKQVLPSVAPA